MKESVQNAGSPERRATTPHYLQEKKYKITYYLVDLYFVLKHLLFPLTMVFIGLTAFCLVSPGKDMMKILGDNSSVLFHFFMALFVIWWSSVMWYGSRVVLHYSHIEYINEKFNINVQIWLPRIFGLLSFVVFITGIMLANGENSIAITLVYIVIALTLFMLFVFRREIFKNKNLVKIESGALKFRLMDFLKKWKFITVSGLIYLVLFIMILISPVRFTRIMDPMGVVVTAFASWSALGLILKVIDKVIYFPLLIVLVICALLFGRFNFNNIVPTNQQHNTVEIKDYFDSWYTSKKWDDTTSIFIITAEGGASRSAYWTGRILSEIQKKNPDFYDHIFALTSVSGGSLGVTTYFVLMESLKDNKASFNNQDIDITTRNILSNDFLAPVTAGMLYPNLLQQFLPVRFKAFNRARYLQKGWVNEWKKYSTIDFNKSFTGYWTETNPGSPLLVLNTTRVESGKRATISFASFNTKIADLEDILHIDTVDANFTIQNAVSASAAFPYISPSTRIRKTNHKFWGNLVDGGYFENSGVYTAIDIYNHIKESDNFGMVKVHFLVIKAFPDGDNYYPNLILNEAIDPVRAIMKTRGARGPHSFIMLENIIDPEQIIKIQLNRDAEVPVNWYLSEKALNIMENEILNNKDKIKQAATIVSQ